MISITPSCWELFGQFLRLTGFEEYRLAVLWKQIMNQLPVKWVKEMNYHHHMLPTVKLPSGGSSQNIHLIDKELGCILQKKLQLSCKKVSLS